jgi:hypothetical protein
MVLGSDQRVSKALRVNGEMACLTPDASSVIFFDSFFYYLFVFFPSPAGCMAFIPTFDMPCPCAIEDRILFVANLCHNFPYKFKNFRVVRSV